MMPGVPFVDATRRGTFAAPDMVIDYVVDHGYRPPEAFVEAVLSSMETGSSER